MAYDIIYSGGTITLAVGAGDTSSTSLTLIGRNYSSANAQQGYGQALNQNYVSLLENFAANATTGPASPITGQIWYDTTTTTLNYNTSTTVVPTWVPLIGSGPTVDATFGSVTTANLTTGGAAIPGAITGNWSLTAGSQLTSTYADLAEFYLIDKGVGPATVVEFGGPAEIMFCDTDMSQRVAGVVSTKPAFIMNGSVGGTYPQEMIALSGRVPCKVIGKTRKGDMMVSAGKGCARSESNPLMGSVIGKSLENKDTEEIGIIEVVVGRL